MALIVGLQVSYGGVPSDVHGDSSPDLQRSYFTLLNGETITSAVRHAEGYERVLRMVSKASKRMQCCATHCSTEEPFW